MQALERAVAVFCTACVCAELLARLVGKGWGQRCIKAVAGLYILVVLLDALPGAKAQLARWKMPQTAGVSFGSMEDAVLAKAQRSLAEELENLCRQQTGISVKLEVSLTRTAGETAAAAVQVTPQDAVSSEERQRVETFLAEQLRLEPKKIRWQTPGGEETP